MMKESFLVSLKIIVAFGIVYLLNNFLGTTLTIVLTVTVFVLYVLYVIIYKGNSDSLLENLGKAKEYLEYTNKKYEKDENLLKLHRSYGLFYLNNVEESLIALNGVSFESLKKNKHIYIYYLMKMKHAAEILDAVEYKKNYDLLLESGVLTFLVIDKEMFEGQYLVLNGQYQLAWDLFMEWIPKIRFKYFILEHEYYLSICHIKLEKFEDAKAVLEFVTNKKMDYIYIEKCKKLLEETKELENINLEEPELIG